jgi:Domain of unknown function (DUF4476)
MRYILYLFLFILSSNFSYAQLGYGYGQVPNGSELHIKLTEQNTPFLVSIDQRLYYNPDGYFSMGNLNGGYHDFKLYRYIPFTLNRVDSTLLICAGTLYIAPAARMLVVIDPSKRFYISQYYNPLQYSMNNNLYNPIYSKYFPIIPYNCQDSTSFKELLQLLNDVPFIDLKVTLIKESIFFNGIRSAQLKELMQLFAFDKDKLSLAVFSYGSCIDKQNFNLVSEAFSFTQSKQELKNQLVFYYNYGSIYLRR